MKFYTINGTYGSNQTPTEIFCAEDRDGLIWYVAEGGETVNATSESICDGVDIETVEDFDCFTWGKPIESLDELIEAMEN